MAGRGYQVSKNEYYAEGEIDIDLIPRKPEPRPVARALFQDRNANPVPSERVIMLDGETNQRVFPRTSRTRTRRDDDVEVLVELPPSPEGPRSKLGRELSEKIAGMEARLRDEMAGMEDRLRDHQTTCANSLMNAILTRLQRVEGRQKGQEELVGNSMANAEALAKKHFDKLEDLGTELHAELKRTEERIGNLIHNTMTAQLRLQAGNEDN